MAANRILVAITHDGGEDRHKVEPGEEWDAHGTLPKRLHIARSLTPVGVRVMADHQRRLRHSGFARQPDLSPERDHVPSIAVGYGSRRIYCSRGRVPFPRGITIRIAGPRWAC